MKKNIQLLLGLIFVAISFISLFVLDIPTLKKENVTFASTYNEKEVYLKGTLYEQPNAEYAVLICPGYSCDRQKWRVFSNLFASNGYTVLTFDYAGQGASSSTIGFDNAKTDAIPKEIDDALTFLHNHTQLPYDHIILAGHSMGGRSILRLFYDYYKKPADTQTSPKELAGAILMAPEVNYEYNAQASLFAGTSDALEEPWKSYSKEYVENTPVYLIGSYADDIVSAKDVELIYERLGGKDNANVHMDLVHGILHSYEMYSVQVASCVNKALSGITKNQSAYAPQHMILVYVGWLFGLLGVGFVIYALNKNTTKAMDTDFLLIDEKSFLKSKVFLWLLGIVVAFIICSLCVVIPFGSPVMNIPYLCFIAGYGIVMLFVYRKNKMKGVNSKFDKLSVKIENKNKGEVVKALLIMVALCFFVWFVLYSTMYRLIPFNARLFWVVVASILMGIGYYISGIESDMLAKAKVSKKTKLLYSLNQYFPLFLLALFYLVIGSYSGLIGQVQNLILMYIFCIPLGDYVRAKTGSRLLGAILTAFLFQTIMITSAALISMF